MDTQHIPSPITDRDDIDTTKGLDGPASVAGEFSHIVTGGLGVGILKFGTPLVLGMVLQGTYNLVDSYIVSRLPNGTESLSALPIGDILAMVATIVANGVAAAAVAIIARCHGEGDSRGVSHTTGQSLGLIFLLSVFFGFFGLVFAEPLTRDVLGAKGVVQELAEAYVEVIVGGAFSMLVLWHMVAILRAIGDSKIPMLILIGSNVLNLVLAVTLVFGQNIPTPDVFAWGNTIAGWFGLDGLGVVGAAWATVIARTLAIVAGGVMMWRKHEVLRFSLRDFLPNMEEQSRLIRIAWPNSAQALLRILIVLFFTGIITHLFTTPDDSSALAAYGICIRLETVALFVGMGWGAAASTFVGQNLGADQPARAIRAGWISAAYNIVMMLVLLATYVAFAPEIIAFFDESPAVVEVGAEYLRYVGASYIFLGIGLVLSQALTGAGATLSSMVVDAGVLIGLLIPATLAMLVFGDLTRIETWLLIAGGNVLTAIAHGYWFSMKRWVHKII